MSRHFCCCIPVRVAVFVTSLLAFLLAAIVSAASWLILIRSENPNDVAFANLTKNEKIAFGIIGGVYTLICMISLFGFIGSIMRRRSFVALYSKMCYAILAIQIVACAYFIYSLFHTTSIHGVTCQVDVAGNTENCNNISKKSKIVVIVILVIGLLIQAYVVGVIHRYVRQLDEEQSYHRTSGYVDTAFKMGPTNTYYPHQPLNQSQGLLAPQEHYPYSDPHHSFGS